MLSKVKATKESLYSEKSVLLGLYVASIPLLLRAGESSIML
jgi:hypothetical protein